MIVKIFTEGGGGGLEGELRRGFRRFYEKAGLRERMPKPLACGGRSNAIRQFCKAVKNPEEGVLPILLVDSEDPITTEGWEHVKNRTGDKWDKPAGATEDDLYFMVQCMETWFLADRDSLAKYFGQGFEPNKLSKRRNIEEVPRKELVKSLSRAARNTKKKVYSKGKHSFEVIGELDPAKVRAASPHADRLLKFLDEHCSKP